MADVGSGTSVKKAEEVVFFGEADRDPRTGKLKSEYPCWYFREQISELENTISEMEASLKRGVIRKDLVGRMEEELKQHKERLALINASTPSFNKDRIAKERKELGERIGEAMFSYSQMEKGTADAHEEARRMSEPCIAVPVDIAQHCGVRVMDGKANRVDAERLWKIMSRGLGEGSNTETLRRR